MRDKWREAVEGEEGEEVAGVTMVDIMEEENPRLKNLQQKSVR